MERGHRADDLAVDLFGPGMVDVAAAQTRLDMADRDFAVKRGECAAHRTGRVALHDHPVGRLGIQRFADSGQKPRGQRVEALVRAHHREIVVGHNLRDIEHLVQHRAVLPGRDDHRRKARVVAQQVDQREELDRLRPGAEDDRNLERRIGVRAGHVARLRKIG